MFVWLVSVLWTSMKSGSRKSTVAEAKLKEKEYDKKQREKLKSCPENLEKLIGKERIKY